MKLFSKIQFSDVVANFVGSWKFIIIQSSIFAAWIIFNFISIYAFDPYPFVFLNLVLAFFAAYSAPIIMMSQNRQSDIDRNVATSDLESDLRSEDKLKDIHNKLTNIENHLKKPKRIIKKKLK